MALPSTRIVIASAAAVGAAFIWATYYVFVLWLTPGVGPAGLVAYPFLFGGLAYAGTTLAQKNGRWLLQLSRSPVAYVRIGLIVTMQLSVLAATYVAGAVDTSILSLLGDTVATPVLVMAILGESRAQAHRPAFVGGVVLASAGGCLTIIAGTTARPLSGWGVILAPIVVVAVALYFLLTAQENRRMPASAVVAHSTLGGALLTLVLSPIIPGGFGGLAIPGLVALSLLIALGVTSFFIAPTLYFLAIRRAGLVLPAILMATIPVFTLGLTATILGVVPPALAILGIPVALVGAILAASGEHPPWDRSADRSGVKPSAAPIQNP